MIPLDVDDITDDTPLLDITEYMNINKRARLALLATRITTYQQLADLYLSYDRRKCNQWFLSHIKTERWMDICKFLE
ncbi:MAG: hypothetical protein WCG98_00965 [bacterium]